MQITNYEKILSMNLIPRIKFQGLFIEDRDRNYLMTQKTLNDLI